MNETYNDRNLLYCQNEEQVTNYNQLKEMGFQSKVVFGGIAYIYGGTFEVSVPLTLNKEKHFSFTDQVLHHIFDKGLECGQSKLRKELKNLLKI